MHLITSLLLLLVAARVCGEFAERLRQPAMLGEITAGIILGPTLLHLVPMTPALGAISNLGVLFLVLLTGMELDPAAVLEALQGKKSAVALAGFFVPLFLGILVGAGFGLDSMRMIFLGLCIAVTALPVAVRMLMDIDELHSPCGRQIIAAAAANDVMALLILGIVLGTSDQPSWLAFAKILSLSAVKVAALMAAFVGAYRIARRAAAWAAESKRKLRAALSVLKGKETLFAGMLLLVLLFASLSEIAGLNFVVGAFFGAMLISRELLGDVSYEEVQRTASGITMGFLAPIFFAGMGLDFDLLALPSKWFVAAAIAAAFIGKFGGGYWGGRMAGFSKAESRIIACGINGRGILNLVIANIALRKGFIGPGLFSALILMSLATTLATPALLKRALRAQKISQ